MEDKLSKKQISTLELIKDLEKRFGKDQWITKAMLPHVTQHTMDALVNKNILEYVLFNGTAYYRRIR